MNNSEEIQTALKEMQPLFFPGGDRAFRKAFIQRWYSDMKRRFKVRTRAQDGTHKGVEGTFVWTEEIQ